MTDTLCPISNHGSPVTLLKFQMAPKLRLLISSGAEKKYPDTCVRVRPKPRIHKCGLGFPLTLHTSFSISFSLYPHHPSIHIWRYGPFRALASLMRGLYSSIFSALLLQPLIPSSCNASLRTTSAMFEHSMCQKWIPFPCSQVVFYLLNPSEASLRLPECKVFSGVGSSPPTPNSQPGGPGCPFFSGSPPLTCPAWMTLPVAMLLPA